jgi:hypothetical protein
MESLGDEDARQSGESGCRREKTDPFSTAFRLRETLYVSLMSVALDQDANGGLRLESHI